VAFFGKIVFDFFNNDDEDFKTRSLRSLAKDLRKEFNISCLPIEEFLVENPERGTLAIALTAANHDRGKALLDQALAFLDGKAPARILAEELEETEIP
jgi:uncharacterized protein YlxP (DUF503 family)